MSKQHYCCHKSASDEPTIARQVALRGQRGHFSPFKSALAPIENPIYNRCMIARVLAPRLLEAVRSMPVVAVTGPRQSGKTTLCRGVLSDYRYVSLEPLDTREFAQRDPRGFLSEVKGPVILDEIQRAPDLFSYLQESVDEDPTPGRFVLTGSEHFGLSQAISQSLAGRVRLLHLLPLSLEELVGDGREPSDLWSAVWTGGYPRIHAHELPPSTWLADYTATYVQRDVRSLLNVANLGAFSTFLRLTAGRTGQEVNLSTLGADVGVSHPTVRAWLSLLETSFLVFSTPPWLRNLRKRQVKAAKMHMVDSGLACSLLGIGGPEQLASHPLRGAIFESWVASEVLKWRGQRGLAANLYHLREPRGVEIDLVVEGSERRYLSEIKSARTLDSSFFAGLRALSAEASSASPIAARLVFGGEPSQRREGVEALSWRDLATAPWD